MTADTHTASGLDRGRAPFVATYARHLQEIPEPPETFIQRELPPEARELFDRLRANDLIHRVEYDTDEDVHRWRLDENVANALDRVAKPLSPGTRVTPCCAYRGFSNVRDGGFRCGFCDEEFDDFHVVEEAADA